MLKITEFWNEVRQAEKEVEVSVAKQTRQPSDGAYIVSIRVRGSDIKPGVVSLCTRRIAAQRIVEGTHALATDEQIAEYVAELTKRREAIQAEVLRQRNVYALGGSKS